MKEKEIKKGEKKNEKMNINKQNKESVALGFHGQQIKREGRKK